MTPYIKLFLISTALSLFAFTAGYAMLFYGGHLNEAGRYGSLWVAAGRLLLWPVEIFFWLKEMADLSGKSLSIIGSLAIQNVGYLTITIAFSFILRKSS